MERNKSFGNEKFNISTFFPDHWSSEKVFDKVCEALADPAKRAVVSRNHWIVDGRTSEGMPVRVVLRMSVSDDKCSIIMAYPLM